MAGYRNAGTVMACGDHVSTMRPGRWASASYGHRTRSWRQWRQRRWIGIPDDISDALALLSILCCVVAKGVRKVEPRPEEPALVMGAGAMGLLTVFVLRAYGLRHVNVVESVPGRRGLAMRLAARITATPEGAGTDGSAVGFECSGRDTAFSLLQGRLRSGGRLCMLSDGNLEPLVLRPEFHEKELAIVASSEGWDYREHARWHFDVLLEGEPAWRRPLTPSRCGSLSPHS